MVAPRQRALFRRGRAGHAVRVETDPLHASSPELLFERNDVGYNEYVATYDVAPDGRFLMPVREASLREFRIVQNWLTELEKLVSTP